MWETRGRGNHDIFYIIFFKIFLLYYSKHLKYLIFSFPTLIFFFTIFRIQNVIYGFILKLEKYRIKEKDDEENHFYNFPHSLRKANESFIVHYFNYYLCLIKFIIKKYLKSKIYKKRYKILISSHQKPFISNYEGLFLLNLKISNLYYK